MKLGYILFYVDDVQATMNFYEKAFDLKKGFLHESNQYGEMITGLAKLGFVAHETAKSHGFEYQESNLNHKPAALEIGLISANVEASYAKAIEAGATGVSEPKKKPWGQIVSYVRDLNGNLIEICSNMED
jgi:lactoylglutathione lyase